MFYNIFAEVNYYTNTFYTDVIIPYETPTCSWVFMYLFKIHYYLYWTKFIDQNNYKISKFIVLEFHETLILHLTRLLLKKKKNNAYSGQLYTL